MKLYKKIRDPGNFTKMATEMQKSLKLIVIYGKIKHTINILNVIRCHIALKQSNVLLIY